jgi:hypothetical protein
MIENGVWIAAMAARDIERGLSAVRRGTGWFVTRAWLQ